VSKTKEIFFTLLTNELLEKTKVLEPKSEWTNSLKQNFESKKCFSLKRRRRKKRRSENFI